MGRIQRWLGITLLLSGCASDPTFFALPEDGALSSSIVVHQGAEARAWAIREGQPISIENVGAEDSVFVLRYEDSLAELGLEPGELTSATRSCRLLDPAQLWRTGRDSDDESALLRVDQLTEEALSPEMIAAVVGPDARRCARCPEYEIVGIPTGEASRPTTAVALPTGEVLVAYQSRGLFVATRSSIEPIDCPVDVQSAALLADGRVWAARAADGWVLDIDLATRTCSIAESWPVPVDPPPDSVARGPVWSAASPPGEPEELWALTGVGQLWRRSEDRWSLATTLELHPRDLVRAISGGPRVAWLGEHRAVATVSNSHLVFVEGGQVRRESPPVAGTAADERDRLPGIGRLADGRIFAGGSNGEVFERVGSGYRIFEGTPVLGAEGDVTAFLEVEHGLVFIVEGGRVLYAQRERAICPNVLSVPGSVGSGALSFAFPDGSIAIANFVGSSDSQSGLVWLVPVSN